MTTEAKEKEQEPLQEEDAPDKKAAPKEKKSRRASSGQKKIKELEEKIKTLEEEKGKLKDQSLRKMAEFENYKRRTEKEFLAHLEFANEGLIQELLPVIDDIERFLDHAENSESTDSLIEGLGLIYRKMMGVMDKKGLKKMETIGQEFDAEQHQALMQVDSDEYESGFVVDEHLKGYLINEKVIRHAQVLVRK